MPYIDAEVIGSGGFSEVKMCYSEENGEAFARKVLTSRSPEDARRFRREVEILQILQHPHIMMVVESDLESTPPSYVMPRYRRTLKDAITEFSIDHGRILPVFDRILGAVEYAHSHGIIHRDLNPRNILMNSDEDLVITDFGLGRRLNSESTTVTRTAAGMGTSGYMAPEQYRDAHAADERADVFALGKILQELYTGSVYPSPTLLPHGLSVIVMRCTKLDRDDRFRATTDIRGAIARIVGAVGDADKKQMLRNAISSGQFATETLIDAIPAAENEPELLREFATRLPAQVFAAIHAARPEIASLLVETFSENCERNPWQNFAYTDVIGRTCVRLHDAVRDFAIRARLVTTCLKAGVDYNRFDVMDSAARLLEARRPDAEMAVLAAELEPVANLLSALGGRLERARLHPALQALLALSEATKDK